MFIADVKSFVARVATAGWFGRITERNKVDDGRRVRSHCH